MEEADETEKRIYRGRLVWASNGEDANLVGLQSDGDVESDILAAIISADMDELGRYLSVRYIVSEAPIPEADIPLELVKMLSGVGDAIYQMRYSEITGYLWTDEEIQVGGHDLLEELRSEIGKYLHMEITFHA